MAISTKKQEVFSADEIKSGILSHLEGNDLYQKVSSHLACLDYNPDFEEENLKAEKWLEWAVGVKELKVIHQAVPVGILPNGYQGTLIDVKVFSKRGPDDGIYDNNEEIRAKVARGNTFLHIDNGPYHGTTCILYAMKKFTGGLGDDDDKEKGDNHTWKKYFTKPIKSTNSIVATRKANGEAAHLSCRNIDGEFLLCGGSKNVHMLFRKKLDIKRYPEDRFRIAREVCKTVMDVLEQMDPNDKHRLLSFLALTHYTAVFEILAPHHQHVEDLSYLSSPQLKFITWTLSDLEPSKENQLCTVPPHIGIEIARALGLTTVDYEMLPLSHVENRMKRIREGYSYEGEVLYFLDSSGSVMGLLKKKTIWYILCRAIREKVRGACASAEKSPNNYSVSKSINMTEKRITEIQEWLGLDEDSVRAWKDIAMRFLKWCLHRCESGNLSAADIMDQFPVLWKLHLEESGMTDRILACWQEPSGSES
ncbi:uncharacterized protein LOC121388446 [Gigantopelta aegis]|uniref:uncharacterized protein LOC121388446 n=1 Tax=Gigantopelta aegis TaxID=1735272 RepID=UPI001B88B35A|nr:uncharacterized protein LOC121388446 [Gigantopelta aegis]